MTDYFFCDLNSWKFRRHRNLQHFIVLGIFKMSLIDLTLIGHAIPGMEDHFADTIHVCAHPALEDVAEMEPQGMVMQRGILPWCVGSERASHIGTEAAFGSVGNPEIAILEKACAIPSFAICSCSVGRGRFFPWNCT